MTLARFEHLMKKANPRLHLRKRGHDDVVGVYEGSEYLFRINQGELHLNGYRVKYFTEDMQTHYGPIERRGRKTAVRLLLKMRKIKPGHAAILLWGKTRDPIPYA